MQSSTKFQGSQENFSTDANGEQDPFVQWAYVGGSDSDTNVMKVRNLRRRCVAKSWIVKKKDVCWLVKKKDVCGEGCRLCGESPDRTDTHNPRRCKRLGKGHGELCIAIDERERQKQSMEIEKLHMVSVRGATQIAAESPSVEVDYPCAGNQSLSRHSVALRRHCLAIILAPLCCNMSHCKEQKERKCLLAQQ